jgi:hypothetical protein
MSFKSLSIQLLCTFNERAFRSHGNEGSELEAILVFILDLSYRLRHRPDDVDIAALEGLLEITCVEGEELLLRWEQHCVALRGGVALGEEVEHVEDRIALRNRCQKGRKKTTGKVAGTGR